MGSCYKTFRVTKEEDLLIKRFLKANPLLDFSTLARAAIRSFINEPKINLKSVNRGRELVSIEKTRKPRSPAEAST